MVRKVLVGVFPYGLVVQVREGDGIGSVVVRPGITVRIHTLCTLIILVHHHVHRRISDIRGHAHFTVRPHIPQTANRAHLLVFDGILRPERILVVTRFGTPFLGTDNARVGYGGHRAGYHFGAPLNPALGSGVFGLVQTGGLGKGLIAHPHAHQLVDGARIPAHFVHVDFPIPVVVTVAGHAGISQVLVLRP